MERRIYYLLMLLSFSMLFSACEEEEYALPQPNSGLANDVIKRTLGPNVVGLNIEFAHAMALPQSAGKLVNATVEASIPGATGTWMEHNGYFTNGSGVDVPVPLGEVSVTDGGKTQVNFNYDTSAATLRYYYVIPEAARGKSVDFTFSATSSNGQKTSYKMGPYQISNMDMMLNLEASETNRYISIEDMAVYDEATALASPGKIDLVYNFHQFNVTPAIPSSHAFLSPVADQQFRPNLTIPSGLNNNSKVVKVWALRDRHLANMQFGIYIDDVDFREKSFDGAPNYSLNMRNESGIWVETADGKYRAYIYVNKINNAAKSVTISMKRLQI